ncbi:hypothetical protein T439DRAFT_353557 [Meredithblackwellia eburnea MCA 4105]
MVGFAAKFIAGGLVAGTATLFYDQEIKQTTSKVTADLHKLSLQLTSLAPQTPDSTQAVYPTAVPSRLPFSEQLKARWNEKLLWASQTAHETTLTEVVMATWAKARSLIPASAESSSTPGAVVEAPTTKQV